MTVGQPQKEAPTSPTLHTAAGTTPSSRSAVLLLRVAVVFVVVFVVVIVVVSTVVVVVFLHADGVTCSRKFALESPSKYSTPFASSFVKVVPPS